MKSHLVLLEQVYDETCDFNLTTRFTFLFVIFLFTKNSNDIFNESRRHKMDRSGRLVKDGQLTLAFDALVTESMSKAFTAAAISLLVDDNQKHPDVQWNSPVSRLIRDDFVRSDSRYTEEVTVEDILSHRSGLPECISMLSFWCGQIC